MDDEEKLALFFEVHSGNPREGPGSAECTRRAFELLTGLPPEPKILDVGCGPGAQTLDLARLTDGHITAVDNHRPFLDVLSAKIADQGLGDRITVVHGDMNALRFADGSFDVVWSEGAVYIMGFDKGLREWKRFLKEDGFVVLSEATWLEPGAPAELREFWKEAYPAMRDISGNLAALERAGYAPVGRFTLPESAWWEYYDPILKKLPALKEGHGGDEGALEVLASEELEIDLYRKYSKHYGYVFYAARLR